MDATATVSVELPMYDIEVKLEDSETWEYIPSYRSRLIPRIGEVLYHNYDEFLVVRVEYNSSRVDEVTLIVRKVQHESN